nr:Chain S, TNEFAF PEPTIDE [synthetic construct]
TNEFAF